MDKISKTLELFLTLIIVMSCLILIVTPANAQTIIKVPEFTLQYTDNSYDIPASTSIDPFTGKTITNPSQHIENKTLFIRIKTQTIEPAYYLYHQIRMKGHFSNEWTNITNIQADPNSEYTILKIGSVPPGGTADFQVQAQLWIYEFADDPLGGTWHQVMKHSSGWSPTQTIAIPNINPTITPTPTGNEPTDDSVILSLATLALIILVVTLVPSLVLIIFYRKRQRGKPNE